MNLLEKILLATDFTESSKNVVENAVEFAKIFQSEITLIYVLPGDIRNEKAKALLKESANKQLDDINDLISSKGVKTGKPILKFGKHYNEITETADAIQANLIIVGAGEKLIKDTIHLGSTAEKIVRKSSKPVFVIQNDKSLSIKNILCPVDFSKASKRAVKNAITLARRFKAKLTILSVYETAYLNDISHKINVDKYVEQLRLEDEEEMIAFLKDFNLTDLNWAKEIRSGEPSKQILKASESNKSDLVIMGTTGKSGISRFIIGSVTEKVIRKVPTSFITLKTEDFINLSLNTRIQGIQKHYDDAIQLTKDGFFNEAVNEFKICLSINDMHVPSLNGLSRVFLKLGDEQKSKIYKDSANQVLSRLWDKKVEEEIRKSRS